MFDPMGVPRRQGRLDDREVAKCLIKKYNFLVVKDTHEILVYENGIYRAGGEELIWSEVEESLDMDTSNHFVKEVVGHIERSKIVSLKDFDSDPYVLNLKNGLYHLKTGQVTAHDPKYYSKIQLPVNYDPLARSKEFERFMTAILPDLDQRLLTIDLFASCLWRTNTLKKNGMFVGDTDSGKSTYLSLISATLGIDNVSNVSLRARADRT